MHLTRPWAKRPTSSAECRVVHRRGEFIVQSEPQMVTVPATSLFELSAKNSKP
jgi:hypothetical protein